MILALKTQFPTDPFIEFTNSHKFNFRNGIIFQVLNNTHRGTIALKHNIADCRLSCLASRLGFVLALDNSNMSTYQNISFQFCWYELGIPFSRITLSPPGKVNSVCDNCSIFVVFNAIYYYYQNGWWNENNGKDNSNEAWNDDSWNEFERLLNGVMNCSA